MATSTASLQNLVSVSPVKVKFASFHLDHKTTRIRIQTAGLAFGGTGLCSCRVRGVDVSCAKHLTVESYMVIYAPNSHTYYY